MTRLFRAAFACALLLLAQPAIAADSIKLLSNASATGGTATQLSGGGYLFTVNGTFGGATVTLMVSGPDGTLQASACALTSAGSCSINIGQGASVQAQVSGGSPSGLFAWLQGLGGPVSSGGGGGGGAATIADGADVAQGAKTDASNCSTDTTAVSAIAAAKCASLKLEAIRALLAGTVNVSPQATENHLGEVGGHATVVGGSFTRPGNTTAYAANSLYANSTTAGSVVPVSAAMCRNNGGHGALLAASLSISNPLAYNHSFRLHLFKGTTSSPFVSTAVGDGGTWTANVASVAAIERATIDVTLSDKGSDGAKGWGTRNIGSTANAGGVVSYDCNTGVSNMYWLIETLDAYTPTNGETAAVAGEVVQD